MNTASTTVHASPALVARSPEFLDAGRAYLRAAEGDHQGSQRFGAVSIVNITCLAVENLLYGLCLAWGLIPEGSCLHSLGAEAAATTSFPASAAQRASELSSILDVCSLAPETNFDDVRPEDATRAVAWGRELERAVLDSLPPPVPSSESLSSENPTCSTSA